MAAARPGKGLEDLWHEIEGCDLCLQAPDLAARLDADTYLPFPTIGVLPSGRQRVAYVVVGSEPAGDWVKSRSHAQERIGLGLRNMADGPGNICIQYAIERWLLAPDEAYYLTDLAKCTVPVKVARQTRARRYDLCVGYLAREIQLFRPRTIITIGLDAYRYLRDHRQPGWPVIVSLLHFARTAAANRSSVIGADWRTQAPSLAELEAFARARQLPLHAGKPTGLGRGDLALVAAYRRQIGVVRRVLAGQAIEKHEAGVHVSRP